MDVLLSRLPVCVSRDLADELAVNYCFMNTKGNRKWVPPPFVATWC